MTMKIPIKTIIQLWIHYFPQQPLITNEQCIFIRHTTPDILEYAFGIASKHVFENDDPNNIVRYVCGILKNIKQEIKQAQPEYDSAINELKAEYDK